ncbi:MAG: hypothetical protein ACE5J2_02305 [Nitrososphaerales archaeon]
MKFTVPTICIILLFSNLGLYSYASTADMEGERPRSPIDVTTDKTDYFTGEVVKIKGHVPAIENGNEVNIIVKDANGRTFTKLRIRPTTDNEFAASFTIPLYDKIFPTGKWSIKIGYAIWAARVDINVLAGEKTTIYSITISKPELVTPSPSRDIKVGDEVMIRSEVKNKGERDQRIFYLVQIKDDLGITVSLEWLTRTVSAKEIARFSLTWMPEFEGRYNIETFTWDDIESPTPLSPSQTISLTVTS